MSRPSPAIVPGHEGALTARAAPGFLGTLRLYAELSKPAITRMVVITAVLGAVIAPGRIDWALLSISVFATALVVAGANTLNMVLERDVDARMERTRGRPLPSGRMAAQSALTFGIVVSVVGLAAQTLLVSPLTGALSATALFSYVLIYTPLKRVTPFALHIGAVPGAIPPLIGWATVTGSIDVQALAVFAIMLVWQLPHFAAISVFRRQEYDNAGLRVLSVARNEYRARWAIFRYSAWLLVVSLVPPLVGLGGMTYWIVAWVSGTTFLVWAIAGLRSSVTGPRWARSLFFASMPYLVILLGTLAVSSVLDGQSPKFELSPVDVAAPALAEDTAIAR